MALIMYIKLKRNGLIAAGLFNIIGALVHSRFFTNEALNEADPMVMSNFGLLMIIIWGLVYIGASTIPSSIKWLVGSFAIEKLAYVYNWLTWLSNNNLEAVYNSDFLAGLFYSIYGVNDFLFMLFFIWIFICED